MARIVINQGNGVGVQNFFSSLTSGATVFTDETAYHFTLSSTNSYGIEFQLRCVGDGLTFDTAGNVTGGTITKMVLTTSFGGVASIGQISISAADFSAALGYIDPGYKLATLIGPSHLFGTNGNDMIQGVVGGSNAILGRGGDDILFASEGGDTLHGGSGNDELVGGLGNDTLDGGAGQDSMSGSWGDDTYYADSQGDRVYERPDEGIDTIFISGRGRTTDLHDIEIVHLIGAASFGINFISNYDESDTVYGGIGSATVHFGLGRDVFHGGAGNDIVFGGEGSDTIFGAGGNDKLYGRNNDFDSSSDQAADVLDGGAGNDTLQDVAAGSTLIGGAGNDTFIVHNGVTLVENAGEGYDTVVTSMDLVLSDNIEKLVLLAGAKSGTGNASDNAILGNAAANTLLGGGGHDVLFGFAGKDTLDGGTGADVMRGGLGNDTYHIDQTDDAVVEGAGEGTDTVIASASFTLRANVENLTLTGTAIEGTGNGLQNMIIGDSMDNILRGGGGDDLLVDGNGRDTFDGGSGQDIASYDNADVTSLAAGAIVDLQNAAANAGLAAGDQFISIEGLIGSVLDDTFLGDSRANGLNGGAGNDHLDGRGGDDILLGDGGNDTLIGGDGSDQLTGGHGHDVLKGGAGSDDFIFHIGDVLNASSSDHIVDFLHGTDKIALGFYVADFKINSNPDTYAGTLIYRTATHTLYFDPDGVGSAAAVAFAVFDNGATLSGSDFVMF